MNSRYPILVSLSWQRSFVEIEIFVVQLPRKEHLPEIELDGYFRLLLYDEAAPKPRIRGC